MIIYSWYSITLMDESKLWYDSFQVEPFSTKRPRLIRRRTVRSQIPLCSLCLLGRRILNNRRELWFIGTQLVTFQDKLTNCSCQSSSQTVVVVNLSCCRNRGINNGWEDDSWNVKTQNRTRVPILGLEKSSSSGAHMFSVRAPNLRGINV